MFKRAKKTTTTKAKPAIDETALTTAVKQSPISTQTAKQRREELITNVEKKLTQGSAQKTLFVIRWIVR